MSKSESVPVPPANEWSRTVRSRSPLERMLYIHQAIHAKKYPNASTLGRDLEVSPKSIRRDIDFMRDRLHMPIEYDGQRFGFFYTEEVKAFPTMQISEGELVALVVAEKALQQYRGTSFEKPLLSAIRKMEQSMPETVSVNLSDIEHTISFKTSAESILNLQTFDILAKATAQHKQLELSYRKPGSRQGEARLVDPYHLANVNGEWFLFAFDHLRQAMRTFVPARIESVRPTGKTFERPQGFSVKQRLRDSFGVHSGEGTHQVVIRFNARAADFIREKIWHESQQLRDLDEGGVEMKLKLSSLLEIERWVLSWGGEAVVVKPKELLDSVKAAALRICES